MKVSKEEIENLAEILKYEVSDSEIEQIQGTINDIGSNLDMLLQEEGGDDPFVLATDQVNQFNDNFEEECEVEEIFKNLNNFDGEFIRVKRGQNEE